MSTSPSSQEPTTSTVALFEFFRNNVLDARESFRHASSSSAGISLAAPSVVLSGKTRRSSFGNYEGFRFRREGNSLTTVPTAAMMRGDFSRNVNGTLAPPHLRSH